MMPGEMAWVAWRLQALRLPHDPQDFTVTLRLKDERDAVAAIGAEEYVAFRPYLRPEQARRTDDARPGAPMDSPPSGA